MALPDKDRQASFDAYDADTKSMLMRTHTERWLDKNRHRLSASQVQLVRDLVAYMSPEAYGNPADPAIVKRGRELAEKLECRFWNSDLMAAFGPHRSPPKANRMTDVWTWLTECVIG